MDSESSIPKKSKIDCATDFKITRMKEKIKATNPHKHNHYHEIIYLTKGEGFHTIDMHSSGVQPPQLFLIKAGQVHYWEFTAIPKGFVIIFRSDFLVHFTSPKIISGFEQLQTHVFELNNNQDVVSSVFKQMEQEYNFWQEYSNHIIASLLEILLARMIRLSAQTKEASVNSGQKLVNEYQQRIHNHLSEYHLVKDYAKLLHVTPKHLNETCTSIMGKTASEILTEALLLEAKRCLLYTPGTVADIAYALGFNDASNFGSFFKKHTSVAPGIFRKKML